MKVLDSCGWLEVFNEGPLANAYRKEISGPLREILVPAVVVFEVYRFLARARGEERAMQAAAFFDQCRLVDLDMTLALEAADAGAQFKLAMADAIVYATALHHRAELVTSHSDLKGLPGVRFIGKK